MEHRQARRAVKTVADIGEDALVRRLTRHLPLGEGVIAGAGDDCAVLRAPARGEVSLFKTDCIVEGIHFTADTPAKLVGRKAITHSILMRSRSRTVRYIRAIHDLDSKTIHLRSAQAERKL